MSTLQNILRHAHSGIRWIVLLLLILAIINAFSGWRSGKTFTEADRKKNLFALIFTHVQFLIGLVLYFISPKVIFSAETMKNAMLRFFAVEHLTLMLIAVILITLGYTRSKKAVEDVKKFKLSFWFFAIALVLILVSIPWPPRFGAGWF